MVLPPPGGTCQPGSRVPRWPTLAISAIHAQELCAPETKLWPASPVRQSAKETYAQRWRVLPPSWCAIKERTLRIIKQISPGLQAAFTNSNHHLWNNNGTLYVHYTTHPTSITKERIRRSLKTKCLQEAKRKRDELFSELAQAAHLYENPNQLLAA